MKSEEENFCAKCCKTMNIIDRMFASIPELKEKIEVTYEDVYSSETIEKFGELTPPAIVVGDHLLTEGHVPILKKLASELFKIMEPAKS
ncbi:MAG: hypothetical protein ACFFCE_19790 [Promethearchaeota archaeon]